MYRVVFFVPKGLPKLILPAIVAIEVLSFLSRPVSHSVRFGVFGARLPFIMVVLLFALALLVALLQANVFAILTCIYLNDAIHPGH